MGVTLSDVNGLVRFMCSCGAEAEAGTTGCSHAAELAKRMRALGQLEYAELYCIGGQHPHVDHEWRFPPDTTRSHWGVMKRLTDCATAEEVFDSVSRNYDRAFLDFDSIGGHANMVTVGYQAHEIARLMAGGGTAVWHACYEQAFVALVWTDSKDPEESIADACMAVAGMLRRLRVLDYEEGMP